MIGIGQADMQCARLIGHEIGTIQAGLRAQQPQHHRTSSDQQAQQYTDNKCPPLTPQWVVSHARITDDQRKLQSAQ